MHSDQLSVSDKTKWIKKRALEFGFSDVGIAKAEFLKEEADRLRTWLEKGYHGKMSYMENHFDKRTDPTLLVENAKSIICFTYNYYPEEELPVDKAKIAKYAYGRDYHKVIKKKLKIFYKEMNDTLGPIHGRFFVDSAPIMEREWAKRAGLGWVGKNTLIINPKKGSFFFLAEMVLDIELEYDNPLSDHCGTCTKCIDACPTEAITADGYELDASKCISYLTIELKDEELPIEYKSKMENWAFGCDVCQDVCPWNKFSEPHDEIEFLPKDKLRNLELNSNMSEVDFNASFEGSAVKRTGYKGMLRNLRYLEK